MDDSDDVPPAHDRPDFPSRRDPRKFAIGLFLHDDPLAGSGKFLWFSDYDELADSLADAQPPIVLADQGDLPELKELLKRIDEARALLNAGDLEEARLRLNHAGEGYWRIDWVGSFDDLREGNREFECHLRGTFRGGDDPRSERAISAEELAGFFDFVERLQTAAVQLPGPAADECP